MDTKRNVLITGASQGLGYEFAKLFAREKYSLYLVARNAKNLDRIKKELEQTYHVSVSVFVKDLSAPSAAQSLARELDASDVHIDVLVNNAGFATHDDFVTIPLSDELAEIQVNIVTLTTLTKLLLKGMVERGYGRILNIASTAAFQPGPHMAVYYATKAYVLSFSEALSEEVKHTGVTVTALCPGATKTGFSKRAHMEKSLLFRGVLVMDAATVARVGYRGLMQGKRVVVPGLHNKISSFVSTHTPHSLTLPIIKRLQ